MILLEDSIMKNKHLTKSERELIESSIFKGLSKIEIAKIIGKDKSTIGKEIKDKRTIAYVSKLALECKNYQKCKHIKQCNTAHSTHCENYVPFFCKRRDVSPGACNGCSKYSSCRFTKYRYNSSSADKNYKFTLVESRLGIDVTEDEIKTIATVIVPLIKQGQSIYSILQNHPEIDLSEKTIYTYINDGVFRDYGLINIDLRYQVKRRQNKKLKVLYKKRKDHKYLNGRLYSDYLDYIKENKNDTIVQMDTVYNDVTNGPFIQTFKFMKYGFLFALLHDKKTSDSMNKGIDILELLLSEDCFKKNVNIILTDRGTEFSNPDYIEQNNRTKVFYCDPMQSCQKGSIENNHIELRYILPKNSDLRNLGLNTQNDLNLAISHINSSPKEKLEGKSPLELINFLNPNLFSKLKQFGINVILSDNIILKPNLLKK